jgi:hypothetical protein
MCNAGYLDEAELEFHAARASFATARDTLVRSPVCLNREVP